eukprot:2702018-Heterocapsa_arctica.AAC.1
MEVAASSSTRGEMREGDVTRNAGLRDLQRSPRSNDLCGLSRVRLNDTPLRHSDVYADNGDVEDIGQCGCVNYEHNNAAGHDMRPAWNESSTITKIGIGNFKINAKYKDET